MSETPANPIQNTAIPPIDTASTPPLPHGTPKKKNYLPWLLGILVLAAISAISFFVLTGKSRSAPSGSLAQPSDSEEQIAAVTPAALSDPKLVEFVRSYLKKGAETQFKIEKVEGDYAYGTGGSKDGGGFYWAAAKKDGQWNYAFGGNGIPDCSEVEIFPIGTFKLAGQDGKFDDCYNDKSELIDRKTGLPVK